MIEVPEIELLDILSTLLTTDLPKVLLELEEQSESAIRLPPLRYAGPPDALPPGTSLPYALIEIEEATYTEKDRIIKNVINKARIEMKTTDQQTRWYYMAALKTTIKQNTFTSWRINIEKKDEKGLIFLQITEK